MLHGQYDKSYTYSKLLTHPIWDTAFTWINTHANSLPDGEHEIQERNMYANIQSLPTIPVQDAFFEVHEEYIDIHYCLSGGEAIGYAPTGDILEKELNTEKDYQLFYPTEIFSTCIMQPGSFAIFFPKELHMPKLQSGIDNDIKKVVIKIKLSLLK